MFDDGSPALLGKVVTALDELVDQADPLFDGLLVLHQGGVREVDEDDDGGAGGGGDLFAEQGEF